MEILISTDFFLSIWIANLLKKEPPSWTRINHSLNTPNISYAHYSAKKHVPDFSTIILISGHPFVISTFVINSPVVPFLPTVVNLIKSSISKNYRICYFETLAIFVYYLCALCWLFKIAFREPDILPCFACAHGHSWIEEQNARLSTREI